ncbi:unnamed protein product [Nippostrongylus brasiliensis]|uniref:Integrase catalytic domain-containing protein n=1 Tax=Nippostrongylus brasiliensis TaxID=27835 RepID=A0A0N4Y6A8_NIPBR|nr:unnamed protein product [Nippostrongylus brasiliensis]
MLHVGSSAYDEEELAWDQHWSLDSPVLQINTVKAISGELVDDEKDAWDKYWALESAGTEEFGLPQKKEKELIDKQVWGSFNKTVEHRQGGYYVRLPWKAAHPPLPDNKALAVRRLISTWNSLQKDVDLLDQYDAKKEKELIDKQVWDSFNKTVEHRQDGYYVRLPWKAAHPPLPDNKALAVRRLISTWNSLQKDVDLLDQYDAVFQEQLNLNIVEEVNDNTHAEQIVHYIPHQAVLTPHKTTTKLRIVFDASAHYKNCPALNDVLHRGPVILPSLFGILLRFRIGSIGIISDIEKAFLQVRLHEKDRDATRCLWLHDHRLPPTRENTKTLRFTRVTFGLISSPFLLAATTHFHLDTYTEEPTLVQEVKNNMYVDNLVLTADTVEDSVHKYRRTKQMFKELGMNLREFMTNARDALEKIDSQDKSSDLSPKVRGIRWNTRTDQWELSCHISPQTEITKRSVASTMATIYDPLGWLIPLTHHVKTFVRKLWQARYGWDDHIEPQLEDRWKEIVDAINGFRMSLPRAIAAKGTQQLLVTFADASGDAMAACSYLVSERDSSLLMARSKLPSLNASMTIPKMELNACTLAMRLTNSVFHELREQVTIRKVYVLSDSEIVLKWLKSKPNREVGQLVLNRLHEIGNIVTSLQQQNVSVFFGYIPSQHNPADCATRGLTKNTLKDHLWWEGPSFLVTSAENWPQAGTLFNLAQDQEEVKTDQGALVSVAVAGDKPVPELIRAEQAFTFTQAKRILAWVIRFLLVLRHRIRRRNARFWPSERYVDPHNLVNKELSGEELKSARVALVRHHQTSRITSAVLSKLQHLNVKADQDGILRCYGRLGKASIVESAKYPVLIMQKTLFAKLIIRDCHAKEHPGVNHTMALVRQHYWIPQLRSQVLQEVRRCVMCQKFNNLPYKYPPQGDLPSQRVIRSRPFENVGLDYFGPLSVLSAAESPQKCYGCIITCMTTRMVHLDIASDLSTAAFLHLLRRFFGRRGVPRVITSDNAPTFVLGDTILRECVEASRSDSTIARELSDREIEWRYITLYAPWQGGFYERLIKSVKLSLFKSLGRKLLSYEELSTVIVEIEALLNTRPLLYMDSSFEPTSILRPIDFIQKDLQVSFPFDAFRDNATDPTYTTPDEFLSLRTKLQALEALQSSCNNTEKFWRIWQSHYITSLREKHQREVGTKKGGLLMPKKGALVLLCDEVQPRHGWKMGRIEELKPSPDGMIREATIKLSTQKKVRRPVNLLVPLELEEMTEDEDNANSTREETRQLREEPSERHHGYNLRPRRSSSSALASVNSLIGGLPTLITFILLYGLLLSNSVVAVTRTPSIHCIPGGIQLISPTRASYEVCAEDFCVNFEKPQINETVKFPPTIILHEHSVQWKLMDNGSIHTVETICPPAPFCDHIDCTICAELIFNPECWPLGAMIATAWMIYVSVAGCYILLYVPVVIGHPIRILVRWVWQALCSLIRAMLQRRHERQRELRRRDLIELLAITCMFAIMLDQLPLARSCQQTDVFTHSSTTCVRKDGHVQLSRNGTSLHELRVSWKALQLSCEAETDLFTRDTIYRVIDSKRCPHSGSCTGEKCAAVNSSTLVPELEEGNKYPGNTACVESCGGPGCDCFYLSSGCLFYRVYVVPTSEEIFEIFHCNRWAEAAKIQFAHTDSLSGETSTLVAHMVPNVPIKWKFFTLTLTSITVPPLPLLQTSFVSDGNSTAVWNSRLSPALRCDTREDARNMSCPVVDTCVCYPAETKANCRCKDIEIGKWFHMLQNRLPIIYPSMTFKLSNSGTVQAVVKTMTTSEVIVSIQDELSTEVVTEDDLCTASAETLTGCYSCAKGAQAKVICFANKKSQAEVTCGPASFTIPCGKNGVASTIRFHFSRARIQQWCSIACGKTASSFEIAGILKYAHTPHLVFQKWIEGEDKTYSGIQFPDFSHIADVFLHWYKTLVITVATLALAIVLTYVALTTCGCRACSHNQSTVRTRHQKLL